MIFFLREIIRNAGNFKIKKKLLFFLKMKIFFYHMSHLLFSLYFFGSGYILFFKTEPIIQSDLLNECLAIENQNKILAGFVILNAFLILFFKKNHSIFAVSLFIAISFLAFYEIFVLQNLEVILFPALYAIVILFFSDHILKSSISSKLSKESIKKIKDKIKFIHLKARDIHIADLKTGNF